MSSSAWVPGLGSALAAASARRSARRRRCGRCPGSRRARPLLRPASAGSAVERVEDPPRGARADPVEQLQDAEPADLVGRVVDQPQQGRGSP